MKDDLAARHGARAPSGMTGWTIDLVRWAIWAALDGNVEEIAQKLREGIASREEMALAADVLEGKVKPRRPRRGQPTRSTNHQIAQIFFQFRVAYPDWPKKKIVGRIVDIFGLKGEYGRHVYDVLKALDPESRKYHEQFARYAVSAYAAKPDELAHFMGETKIARK
jgi:hypothetical protein